MPYCVNYWGSKPGENDDCATGWDYATIQEAQAFYDGEHPAWAAWIELDGPDAHLEKPNPDYKEKDTGDDDWRRECQMQDAMLYGVAGYNDYEGM